MTETFEQMVERIAGGSGFVEMSQDIKHLQAELATMTLEKQMRQMAETRNSELLIENKALAAEVARLREALGALLRWVDDWCDTSDTEFARIEAKCNSALSLPTNHAAILAQRDARTLREAAALANQWGEARLPMRGGHALRNYAEELLDKAAELEANAGKESGK